MSKEQFEFNNIYIERSFKETEEMIKEEDTEFLNEPIQYLQKHMSEFVYVENDLFDKIGVEGISFEVDDLFHTYDVLLGLKLPKKQEQAIRAYLDHVLKGADIKYNLMFDGNDGLWNLNFTLNYVDGFKEDMTFLEAFKLIHEFLSQLIEHVKK